MELDPEVHSHAHQIGHRWIDLVLALSALALSIASIVISIQNEANMQRLVTANSWPYIELSHGNMTKGGEAVINFYVRNAGIGPATLEKLVVTYEGRPVLTSLELLEHCCVSHDGLEALHIGINEVENHVFSPGESLSFLELDKSERNAAAWEKLNVERMKISLAACYSSVFGEHWTTSFRHPKPQKVESCEALPGPAYDANLAGPES